jgi:hypothetical protein
MKRARRRGKSGGSVSGQSFDSSARVVTVSMPVFRRGRMQDKTMQRAKRMYVSDEKLRWDASERH